MKSTKAAGRYAKSLLSLAQEKGVLEEVKADMALMASTIEASHELALMLRSPIIRPKDKQRVLNSIFAGKCHELSLQFVDLITAKGRESLLAQIASAFLQLYREIKGIVMAEVSTASAMTEDQKAALKSALSAAGKHIEIKEKIVPGLIGGLRVVVGDKLIDASIKRKLMDLRANVSNNNLSAI